MITEIEPHIFMSSAINKTHVDNLIKLIHQCEGSSYNLEGVNEISKTDWVEPKELERKYWDYFSEHCFDNFASELLDHFKCDTLDVHNYWYQIYETGDFHHFHTHPCSHFSHVLYLKTGDEQLTDIPHANLQVRDAVGAVLTFPAFLKHRSLPVTKQKIIMAFNTSLQIQI